MLDTLIRGNVLSWANDVDFGPESVWGPPRVNPEIERWFDRWLKDVDNHVENDPPVRLFVMGGGDGRKNADGRLNHGGRWRAERDWPLARPPYPRLADRPDVLVFQTSPPSSSTFTLPMSTTRRGTR